MKEGIVPSREEYEECSGLPIVTIYILGHKLGNVEALVIYVCRRHLNADLNWTGVSDGKHSKKYTLHALWFDCNFAPHNNQTE